MPTRHRRHSITETPRVREALEPLRHRGLKVDLADLLVLGAEQRARQLEAEQAEEERRRELRLQLIERLRTGEGLDVAAAYEVRETGWTH
jgi:hypothetical protein